MTDLPEGFDSWEHLQSTYMLEYNKRVDKFFSDIQGNGDLSSVRGSLKLACRLVDGDNQATWNLRTSLFFDVIGYSRKNLAVLHGRDDSVDLPVIGHPKVCLYFSQDSAAVPQDEIKVDAEYSFRLVNETQATFTPTEARTLATEIKNLFVDARKGIILTKGKTQYLYFHKERGYRLRIYGNTESDAVDIIQKLLQLTNTPYDSDRLSVAVPKRSNTENPGTHIVYGETVKKRKFRPIANVRFRYAYVEIPGRKNPVYLIDTTYRHSGLVSI